MAGIKIVEELGAAYKNEIAGYVFYGAARELMEDPKGRQVFDSLAKDELDHLRVISAIADSLEKGLGLLSYDKALEANALKNLPVFPERNELIDRLDRDSSDISAINIGIEIEENAVARYSGLLKEASTPEERVLLTKLVEMEKGHLKLLRWEGEYLQRNGFWCGEMEFNVEKESD